MHSICKQCGSSGPFYASNAARCAECVKTGVRENRAKNAEYYQAYDRARFYDNGLRGKASKDAISRASKAWKERNRDKRAAHSAVAYAVRSGKLVKPSSCSKCGEPCESLHGHHEDYTKKLEVTWLCPACHGGGHRVFNEESTRQVLVMGPPRNRK